MRRLISRTSVLALSVAVALGAAAVPCAAADSAAAKPGGKLTQLSPASRHVLVSASAPRRANGQTAAPAGAAPSSFFKSTRGKVTLALMGAGTGLTLWSIQHDRKPVKSPIR